MITPLRQITLLIITIGFGFFCKLNAQEPKKIDSLRALNATEQDQKKIVENNNQIAYHFGAINIDSSLFYSHKAGQIAKKINFRNGLAVSYSYTARGMLDRGNIPAAIKNFSIAFDLFKKENDSVNLLDCLRGLSYAASYGSSQLKSLDYNLKALNYANGLKDTASLANVYNNIGAIYKKLGNYKSSLFYFKKSLELEYSKKNSRVNDLAVCYSNIGVLKVDNGKFKEAKEEYSNVIKLLPKVEREYLKSYLFLSLAGYYTGVKEFSIAKKYIDSSLALCEKYDFIHIKSRAYRKKAEWYFQQDLFKESIQYYNTCIEYSTAINVYEEFPEIYKKRAEAYAKLGRFKEAFNSLQTANKSIDSLKNNSVASFLTDFEEQSRANEQEKYKIEQSLKEQQLKTAVIKKKNMMLSGIVAIAILVAILGIVLFYLLKVRNKNRLLSEQHKTINNQKILLENNIQILESKEQKLQKVIATKDKLFSIISHDLKSPFNAIVGFSNLLSENYNSYTDEKRKMMIVQIEKASESAFSLLNNLLYWARSQRGFIEINPTSHPLKNLINESIQAYMGAAAIKEIKVNNTVSDDLLVYVDSETIKIVFSNIFSNAIKFNQIGGHIQISAAIHHKMVAICFQDNGVGMDQTVLNGLFQIEISVIKEGTLKEKGTGLGLILCDEFVKRNNGKIEVESEVGKGSGFYIYLPSQ